MPATAKLYETDPYVQTFTATVLVCTPAGEQFAVQLDRTAFYPEGGGQPCDTGALGTALVTDVQEHGGVITHTVSAALPVGQTVEGRIDWARRRDHMEQHTGEHILSGTLHRLFGAENVGFHIGSPAVRMDMSVPLTAGQLAEAEAQANAVIRADAPVRCWYPAPEDLAKLTYRSKKEIDGAVRLVDAGGADLCACCGTHVSTTGQVGAIKILSAQSYKGGTRLAVVCGERAHQSIAAAWQDAAAVGTLLSSAPGRLLPAVQNLQTAEAALKQRLAAMQNALSEALAQAAVPGQPAVLHCDGADGDGLRRICLAVSARTNALTAVLASGGQGLAYALCLPGGDVRPVCKALNEAFGGRGGGKPGFCQGSLACTDFAGVQNFLVNYHE